MSYSTAPWSNSPGWSDSTHVSPLTPYMDKIAELTAEVARLRAQGLTDDMFKGVDDSKLILELVARGYNVGKMPA